MRELWILGLALFAFAAPASGHRFGLTLLANETDPIPIDHVESVDGSTPETLVVLIHGLDDPGWMWRDVSASLALHDVPLARMEYPNDGPIADAATLFASELARLRALGTKRVYIVAHSMGGLVTREMLTRDDLYAGDGRGGTTYPAVERLVMCGTPNHGALLARLRAVTEIKEHVSRCLFGDGEWGDAVSDGRGEAASDLLPGSMFLETLNARPAPRHTKLTIIAGRMSPFTERDWQTLADKIDEVTRRAGSVPWLERIVKKADRGGRDLVREATTGLGDGCVSLESARLPDVDDFVIVAANHVSMIVNVNRKSDRTPPAVPIILERLGVETDVVEP